ncbi:helix-turn-helix transcriptional regulator [Actinoplanes sp. NPDC049118]|uniref:helix-turn-helix transcriptional regulator n=1 Tax=Actinoplanes sp. NPDC049118 TaxID=3155769 RepID=UPI0033D68124
MPASLEPGVEHIEILPIVVVAQDFPARPSALPDVRDFVRRQLTTTSVADEDIRTLCERVADVLLDAAGVSGSIQVSLRIFPTAAEVDVLFAPERGPADDRTGVAQAAALRHVDAARTGAEPAPGRGARIGARRPEPDATAPIPAAASPSFAAWLAARLRAEGLTMEAAARRLEVSTKTISRWVSGSTEPRLRDLYRIRDVFGEPPFH